MPKGLPMQSILFDAEQMAVEVPVPFTQLKRRLENRGITMDHKGRVHVEIIGPPGSKALSADVIAKFGGEVSNTWRHRVEAWIPIGQLSNVARALPPGYFMQRAEPPGYEQVPGEGPMVTNSDDYRNNGANCTGLTIAVIDVDYDNLTQARNNGDAPPAGVTTQINYTPNPFEDVEAHGTGCLEAAFDHCPGATWRLYKIDSLTDLGRAVNDAVNSGVDVISHSLGWFNTGWADDSGGACAAATQAANAGILFFTAAGNSAQEHWQGGFNDPNGNGWHDWVNGDETIDIRIPPSGGGRFYLSWDTAGGTFDYDLYLYDATLTNVLASSTNSGNNYESFSWTNTATVTQTVHLAVFRFSGGTTDMEVFTYGSAIWQEHIIAQGSTASPNNCTDPLIVSVGAVDWTDYSDPPGSNNIMNYSSRGPSNGGMTLPDLVGPTNTTGFTYPFGFGGTSCATPNAAGTAAAFWSSALTLSAEGVRHLVFEQAEIFKDWGAGGNDNTYGRGGISLHTFHANTVWVDRRVGNTIGSATLPYFFVADAQSAAVSGGRIVFLGQSYPEPVTLNKNLLYETIGWPALLGE
jgi:hypothetical protein